MALATRTAATTTETGPIIGQRMMRRRPRNAGPLGPPPPGRRGGRRAPAPTTAGCVDNTASRAATPFRLSGTGNGGRAHHSPPPLLSATLPPPPRADVGGASGAGAGGGRLRRGACRGGRPSGRPGCDGVRAPPPVASSPVRAGGWRPVSGGFPPLDGRGRTVAAPPPKRCGGDKSSERARTKDKLSKVSRAGTSHPGRQDQGPRDKSSREVRVVDRGPRDKSSRAVRGLVGRDVTPGCWGRSWEPLGPSWTHPTLFLPYPRHHPQRSS